MCDWFPDSLLALKATVLFTKRLAHASFDVEHLDSLQWALPAFARCVWDPSPVARFRLPLMHGVSCLTKVRPQTDETEQNILCRAKRTTCIVDRVSTTSTIQLHPLPISTVSPTGRRPPALQRCNKKQQQTCNIQ